MEPLIELGGLLLLVAALVAMLSRRLRIPYSVGLVVAGALLALLPVTFDLRLTQDLIFTAFLPPLIFEAALALRWTALRAALPVVLLLATLGVLVAAGVTAVGMHYLVGWAWGGAALFGVLIAATDPVSVIALFKETGVRGRLRILVEAESLFNDSTAAVAFGVALTLAGGGALSAGGIAQTLLVSVIGGCLCGAAVAGAVILLAGRTVDHLVELTLTTVAAYGSFLLAEHLHASGVLASLTAGLLVGNVGHLGSISPRGREAVESFWEYAAFVVNSLIFLLIGLHQTRQDFAAALGASGVAIVLVLLGRALAIYPCCALFSRSRQRVSRAHQHVLVWGGLRGALGLALALGLPPELPHREEIVTVTFAVVAFSVFVQGLTMPPLLRRLGETARPTGAAGDGEAQGVT